MQVRITSLNDYELYVRKQLEKILDNKEWVDKMIQDYMRAFADGISFANNSLKVEV